MFHTVLLYQELYYSFYYDLLHYLKTLSGQSKAKYYKSTSCQDEYIFQLFNQDGMTVIMRKTGLANKHCSVGSKINYHAIEIRLNPKVLIQAGEYVRVAKASDYKEISKRFKEVLKPLQDYVDESEFASFFSINLIEQYRVKRIDYCVNICTDLHDRYMELIRRAQVPPGFWIVKKWDEKSKRKKTFEQSLYAQCGSVGINIYNKDYQMKKAFSQYEHLEDAENIIRVEIQCFMQKTNNLKLQHGWRYKQLPNYISEEVARKIIYDYYRKSVGYEDYYTLAEARKRIKDSKHRRHTKEDMIEILELINQKRSVPDAQDAYCSEAMDSEEKRADKKRFNNLVKKIKKCDINPVTIPVNWGITYLPNLVYEIDQVFMPEKIVI